MSKSNLFIHIGCEKTGTTTIQNTLATNRENLLKQGILYPEFGQSAVAHFSLPASLHYLDHPPSSVPGYYDVNGISADNEWDKFINLCRQHRDLDIIISAEHFSSRVNENGLAFMQNKLSVLADSFNIKFILFLRRQDLFLESSFSTVVKSGGTTTFNEFVEVNQYFNRRYNFRMLLDKWLKYFDKSAFIVKEYADSIKHGGLLQAFYDIAGIDGTELVMPQHTHNTSWSKDMLDFAILCNSPRISSILKRKRLSFLEHVSLLPQFANDTSRYRLTSEKRKAILDYYAESNRAIEQEYFNGRTVLTDHNGTLRSAERPNDKPPQNFTKMDILALFATYVTQQTMGKSE